MQGRDEGQSEQMRENESPEPHSKDWDRQREGARNVQDADPPACCARGIENDTVVMRGHKRLALYEQDTLQPRQFRSDLEQCGILSGKLRPQPETSQKSAVHA